MYIFCRNTETIYIISMIILMFYKHKLKHKNKNNNLSSAYHGPRQTQNVMHAMRYNVTQV